MGEKNGLLRERIFKRDGYIRNEKGVTLAEVLGTTIILILILTMLGNLSGFTTMSTIKYDNEAQAMQKAEETLNLLRDSNPADVLTKIDEINDEDYTGERFAIYIHEPEPISSYSFSNGSAVRSKFLSSSSIITIDGIPNIVTVTVSWEG